MKFKTFFKVSTLLVLILLFGKSIILGEKGFLKYLEVKKDVISQKEKIERVRKKINRLEAKIARWRLDDFKIEKIARQHLQMGFPDEKVYLLS